LPGEALEFLQREAIVARGGIHAALEAGEIVAAGAVPMLGFTAGVGIFLQAIAPVDGFGFAETVDLPLVVGERIDEEALFGEGGLPTLVVLFGESCERGGIFAGNDLAFGVHAGFKGIEAGDGLTLKGAGAAGLLRVEAVGLLLFD
jgi:hypothetical protein